MMKKVRAHRRSPAFFVANFGPGLSDFSGPETSREGIMFEICVRRVGVSTERFTQARELHPFQANPIQGTLQKRSHTP